MITFPSTVYEFFQKWVKEALAPFASEKELLRNRSQPISIRRPRSYRRGRWWDR
jgi:hypothetical protein